MQPMHEDIVDPRVAEIGQRLAGLALGRPLPAIGIAEGVEEARDILVAGGERARHAPVQHQEIGDEDRLHRLAIDMSRHQEHVMRGTSLLVLSPSGKNIS